MTKRILTGETDAFLQGFCKVVSFFPSPRFYQSAKKMLLPRSSITHPSFSFNLILTSFRKKILRKNIYGCSFSIFLKHYFAFLPEGCGVAVLGGGGWRKGFGFCFCRLETVKKQFEKCLFCFVFFRFRRRVFKFFYAQRWQKFTTRGGVGLNSQEKRKKEET